jgi:tetratricopeptide (TPR) repeat protein
MTKTAPFVVCITSALLISGLCFLSAPLLTSCGSQSQTASETYPYPDTLENRKKAGKLYLEYMDVKRDKKYAEAEKLINEMTKYDLSSGPQLRGENAYSQGRYADADKLILEAIKIHPENCPFWETAAIYAYRQGHVKEAMERATKSISLITGTESKPSRAYLIRGMAYRREGQLQKALADFDECLKISKEDVEALYFKGSTLDALGKPKEALAAFAEVLRWEPPLQSAIKRRMAIFMRLKDQANARKELAQSETQAKSKMMMSAKDWIPSDLSTEQVKTIVQNPKAE